MNFKKIEYEEGNWMEMVQGLVLQSWVPFTLKEVE
jgi:hypothetical protein